MTIDERNTIFARLSLEPGSEKYRQYYKENPHFKLVDDSLRFLAQQKVKTNVSETKAVEAILCDSMNQSMRLVKELIAIDKKVETASGKVETNPASLTRHLKEAAKLWGADLFGIAKLKNEHFYAFNRSGQPVEKAYRYAVVFAVEMKKEYINRAPHQEEMIATLQGYADAAMVGARISMHLKNLGYRTFLNTVHEYNAPLVRLAVEAGLGQRGRSSMLITPKLGSRVRLGAVMTDAMLKADSAKDFGLQEFCDICGNCARNCPARAIDACAAADLKSGSHWSHNHEKCYEMWLRLGTDCGICIASCPFSQGISLRKWHRSTLL